MLAPLYNDDFRNFLDANASGDHETDIEIMARLIDPSWTRWDDFSEGRRPSLLFIEETAQQFGVQPCEIFGCIVNDILSGETGSGHDLLVELLEWIVLAPPVQRTRVLGGYAVHQRMRLEDRQALWDHEEKPSPIDGAMKAILDDLGGLDTDLTQAAERKQ
jgi:hypothetical protein